MGRAAQPPQSWQAGLWQKHGKTRGKEKRERDEGGALQGSVRIATVHRDVELPAKRGNREGEGRMRGHTRDHLAADSER